MRTRSELKTLHSHLLMIPVTPAAPESKQLPKGSMRAALKASKGLRRKPLEAQALAPPRHAPGGEVSRDLLTRGNAGDKRYLFKPLPARGRDKREGPAGEQGQQPGGVFVQSIKGDFWSWDRKAGLLHACKLETLCGA